MQLREATDPENIGRDPEEAEPLAGMSRTAYAALITIDVVALSWLAWFFAPIFVW